MTKQVVVRQTDLAAVEAVHAKIPEFESSYIAKNIDRIDPATKKPFIAVASVDGVDAGYLIAYEMPDTNDLHIWLNGVTGDYRKHGVFKAMVGALEREARKRGRARITVASYGRFEAMYKSLLALGFKTIEDPFKMSPDVTWFAKKL